MTRPPHPTRPPALVGIFALACAACGGGGGVLCGAGASCAGGEVCVVGRCRPSASLPAPADSRRVVLDPIDVAILADGVDDARPLPPSIPFGSEAAGRVLVLLRFAAPWGDDAVVHGAFLRLEPRASAPPERAGVEIDVARVLEPWSSRDVSWSRRPRLGPVRPGAVARTAPPVPLRIDVTEIVRGWSRRLPDEHGIALVAAPTSPGGAAYATGIHGGAGPTLEVYLE